jgi:hypothetical protein
MSRCSFLLRVAALWGIPCPVFLRGIRPGERLRRIRAKNFDNIASHSGVCKKKMRFSSIFPTRDETASQGE